MHATGHTPIIHAPPIWATHDRTQPHAVEFVRSGSYLSQGLRCT
jgi:hypothetical protein